MFGESVDKGLEVRMMWVRGQCTGAGSAGAREDLREASEQGSGRVTRAQWWHPPGHG